MSERLNLCRLAVERGFTVAQLARDFGVSRETAYKWIVRYGESGDQGVFDRSRRPKSSPNSVGEEIVDAVLALKQEYPMWGPRKLHRLIARRMGEAAPSKSTVGRILSRHGLVGSKHPNAREEAVGRFELGKPNDLWQTDFCAPFTLSDGRKVWPIPILDDHSRYCLGLLAMPDCSEASAIACFRAAGDRYGLPVEVLSDHGSAFGTSRAYVSAFTAFLWALDVGHIQGRYAHPQTQGKLERFNQTLRQECIRRRGCTTFEDWNKCFEEYRHTYNKLRPHESLNDNVPGSCYNPSERAFVEPDRDYREDGDGLIHRRVDSSGKIWMMQHHVSVGSGLAGWTVSANHEGGGIWTILFRGRTVCQVALAKPAPYKPKP